VDKANTNKVNLHIIESACVLKGRQMALAIRIIYQSIYERKKLMATVFRPQRGNLAEAMAEVAAFDSEKEMLAYVKKSWSAKYPEAKFMVKIRAQNDERTGWEQTRYVCMTDNGIDAPYRIPQVVGMCDSDTFKELPKEEALAQVKSMMEKLCEEQGKDA